MNDRGIRSVVGNLIGHIDEYGHPVRDTPQYAQFIDQWSDRLMKASGFFREQEENTRLRKAMAHEGCNALDFCTCE